MSALVLSSIDHPRVFVSQHWKMPESDSPVGPFPHRTMHRTSNFHGDRKRSSPDLMSDAYGDHRRRYRQESNDQLLLDAHHLARRDHGQSVNGEFRSVKIEFRGCRAPGVYEYAAPVVAPEPAISNRHRHMEDSIMHYPDQDMPTCRDTEYHGDRSLTKIHANMGHSGIVDSPLLDPTKKIDSVGMHHSVGLRGHIPSTRHKGSGTGGLGHDPDTSINYTHHRHTNSHGVHYDSVGDSHCLQPRKSNPQSSIFLSTTGETTQHPTENGDGFIHGRYQSFGTSKFFNPDQHHHGVLNSNHQAATVSLNDGHTNGGYKSEMKMASSHVKRLRSNSSVASETGSSHNEGQTRGALNSQEGSGNFGMGTPGSVTRTRSGSSPTLSQAGGSRPRASGRDYDGGESTGDRRGRNNEASRKYRERRRKMEHETLQDNRRLRAENDALKGQVAALRDEVAHLKRCMSESASLRASPRATDEL